MDHRKIPLCSSIQNNATIDQQKIRANQEADMNTAAAEIIRNGKAVMGMELGSTRIKAVLTGPDGTPLASGGPMTGKTV